MSRVNLEQVRARNAVAAIHGGAHGRGVNNGDAISGFPALVVNNGLLATLAFCVSKKDAGGYKQIGDAIAKHLADKEVALVPANTQTLLALRDALADSSSDTLRLCTADTLRLCTAEALAFLNYLKRFAKGETKRDEDEK